MIAGTVSEKELLSVSLHVFTAFRKKNQPTNKAPKKTPTPTKVHLTFLETGLKLVQFVATGVIVPVLWYLQVCLPLPLALHFTTQLKQTSELGVHHHGTFWPNHGLKQ